MEPIPGGEPVFKLGQKQVPSPPDFSRMTITTIYLSAEEYDVFAALHAAELRKRRHVIEHGGHRFGVDVFEAHLEGLVLAEVGFETAEALGRPLELPPWVTREVSDDVGYTGGALARASGIPGP
jgi:CYTH domain-containing protein